MTYLLIVESYVGEREDMIEDSSDPSLNNWKTIASSLSMEGLRSLDRVKDDFSPNITHQSQPIRSILREKTFLYWVEHIIVFGDESQGRDYYANAIKILQDMKKTEEKTMNKIKKLTMLNDHIMNSVPIPTGNIDDVFISSIPKMERLPGGFEEIETKTYIWLQ